MRDDGLERAIDAAGGVAGLARKIGISQPSVSNWNQVPAQRVIAVEAATGVSRKDLRPDLYGEPFVSNELIEPVDAARAQEYLLLATLLSAAPSRRLLDQLAALTGDATPLGRAHAGLAAAAANAVATQVEREYFDLFVGLGRGELLPYASYYLTGFLNERPLSRLRADLAASGIERAANNSEPEDHAAILCEIMAGFAGGRFPTSFEAQRAFFVKHVEPWIGRAVRRHRGRGERRLLSCGRRARSRLYRDRGGGIHVRQLTCTGGSRRDAMSEDRKATVGRRDFLRKVGAGTLGAGATLATPLVGSAQADSETNDEKRKARYKETDHVKAFYRVNRYPAKGG
ncbi:TorA maturation chaperone TorD [Bradyrhizobium japonicum]